MPTIVDHFPDTISTANTKLIFTIDMDTKPIANRKIIYTVNDLTIDNDVPVIDNKSA